MNPHLPNKTCPLPQQNRIKSREHYNYLIKQFKVKYCYWFEFDFISVLQCNISYLLLNKPMQFTPTKLQKIPTDCEYDKNYMRNCKLILIIVKDDEMTVR